MFVIRAEQIEALRDPKMRDFVRCERERITASLSKDSRPPEEAEVRARIDEARDHGLSTESDMARYNDIAFDEGPEFPTAEDLVVLEDESLWGWQKMDKLEASRIFAGGHPQT